MTDSSRHYPPLKSAPAPTTPTPAPPPRPPRCPSASTARAQLPRPSPSAARAPSSTRSAHRAPGAGSAAGWRAASRASRQTQLCRGSGGLEMQSSGKGSYASWLTSKRSLHQAHGGADELDLVAQVVDTLRHALVQLQRELADEGAYVVRMPVSYASLTVGLFAGTTTHVL